MLKNREALNRLSMDQIYAAHKFWKEQKKDEEGESAGAGEMAVDKPQPPRQVNAMLDDGKHVLSEARFFRLPLSKPEDWYGKVPRKRPIIRSMPGLEMTGVSDAVSMKTIEMMHNRLCPVKLKHFYAGNIEVTTKAKTEVISCEGGVVKKTMDYDWAKPQTLQHIKGAMNSYGGVLHELFPTDWTYIALMKTLNKYRWVSRCPNDDFKRYIITDYFNNVMKANAVRAGQNMPPLSYSEHVGKLIAAMEEYGVDTRVPTNAGMDGEIGGAGPSTGNASSGAQQAQASNFGQGRGRGGRGGRRRTCRRGCLSS